MRLKRVQIETGISAPTPEASYRERREEVMDARPARLTCSSFERRASAVVGNPFEQTLMSQFCWVEKSRTLYENAVTALSGKFHSSRSTIVGGSEPLSAMASASK